MAVAFGGFSIREYAFNMRSADGSKCWPFDGDGKLPLMSCRKYRWWLDELEVVRSSLGDEENDKILVENEIPVSGKEKVGIEKPDEEKSVMICPVCRSFTAATVNALNAHIDSCLAQASREERRQMRTTAKVKSRTPKKRSIMEIFAVAPPIGTVESDGCEKNFDSKGLEELDAVGKEKRKHKCLKEEGIVKKLKKMCKKKNMKMKIGSSPLKRTRLRVRKERIHKLKVPSPVDISGQLKVTVHDKRLAKEISDTGDMQKKKQSSYKDLSLQNKLNVVQASKIISKHQQLEPPAFLVHSILKNHTKVISSQNSSAISNVQDGNRTYICHVQQSDRHVRFSDKDDILGPTKEQCSSTEFPQVQWDCLVESDKDLPAADKAAEVYGSNEGVSISITNETAVQSTNESIHLDDVHGGVSLPTFLSPNNRSCQEKEKTNADESLDLNQTAQLNGNLHPYHQGNSSASHTLLYAVIPRLLQSTQTVDSDPSLATPADGNVQRVPNTSKNLDHPFPETISRSAAMSSLANVNATLQIPTSCVAMNAKTNDRYQFLSQAAGQNSNGCALQHQSFCHLSPKDLMSSICSSVEWKKQREAICRDKCTDKDFIGLPLNSQGELSQFCLSGEGGLNQMTKQNIKVGPSCSFPIHNLMQPNGSMGYSNIKEKQSIEAALRKDKCNYFLDQKYQKENPVVTLSSRLGISELQSTGKEVHWQDSLRRNNHSVHQLDPDINLVDISYHGWRQHNPSQNRTEKEMIQLKENSDCKFLLATQPTMRLMGKDVTVGIRNKEVQGFEDSKIWTDKEIITENRPAMAVSDNSSLKRHFQQEWLVHPVSGKPKEPIAHPLEAQSNLSLESGFPLKAVDPRFSHSYLNWQTCVTPQNGLPLISGNPSVKLHPFVLPPPSQTSLNHTSKFPKPCSSGTKFINLSSQIPVPASTSSNACQHMLLNSAELKRKQNLAYGTTSSFRFPFSSQECGECFQPSWSQSSSQSLPQWLRNSTQQKEIPLTSSQPYSDKNAEHHPCKSGTIFSANCCPYNTTIISHSHNSNTFSPHMMISSGPGSFVHPPVIPALPGFKPTSVTNTSGRNRIKVKNGTKSKLFCLKVSDRANKSKKRSATKAYDSAKATKKLNLEMQEDPSSVEGLKKRVCFSDETQYNTGTAEFNAYRDKGRNVGYSPGEIQKDGFKSSSYLNRFKQDGVARSGPVKLSSGAKHTLKPSQNVDPDKSRPTHSTIPFAAVTNSDKIPELQKSAQIYRMAFRSKFSLRSGMWIQWESDKPNSLSSKRWLQPCCTMHYHLTSSHQ